MNRNTLKYIAIIAMTLDHIGLYFVSNPIIYTILRMIGRITFPIMCYFIVEGFKHTANKKKYGLRLFIFALISQIPWTLLHSNTLFTIGIFLNLNTIFSLLFGFLLLVILQSNIKLYFKIPLIILIAFPILLCDYHLITILYILCFFYLDKKKLILVFPLIYLMATILNIFINQLNYTSTLLNIIINFGLFFTIPLFIKYNHESGNKNYFNKYFFYTYYPLHLSIIFLIKLII